MEYGEACDDLAKFIIENREEHLELLGLAIMEFNSKIDDDETPKMALSFAKSKIKSQ